MRKRLSAVCLSAAMLGLMALAPVSADPSPTPPYRLTPTPATQAGHGRDLFYLHCMPCHGDRGQGLTDEFRMAQYPPEDANCWQSGCHGDRPYADGFTLPRSVPALIGPDALGRYDTAGDLYEYIRRAMPFNAPESLSQTEYLQITTFLLEQNGRAPAGAALDSVSLTQIVLRPASSVTTPRAPTALPGEAVAVAMACLALLAAGPAARRLLKRR